MSPGFRSTRKGIRIALDEQERQVLDHLLEEVQAMLDDGSDDTSGDDPLRQLIGMGDVVEPPSDPAVARLLPDAHRDDPEASAEFRRYTERGLRARKRSGIIAARASLKQPQPVLLDQRLAQAWVVALTDLRLVLGSRLGIENDADHDRLRAQPDDASELGFLLTVYDYLSWLQETLVEALLAAPVESTKS